MRLEVYCRRFGRNEIYQIERTPNGWRFKHMATEGDCDKSGRPHLFKDLEHDYINYPEDLGGYMECLWDKAQAQSMNDDQIQEQLDILGSWIQQVEKLSPKGIWSDYK
ncbi:MAG: hypothetical protein KAW02_01105 [candidate division Zixibacteria bacterium]|nr:hypothetical protein [candidate division Zixibacteria bacterium]